MSHAQLAYDDSSSGDEIEDILRQRVLRRPDLEMPDNSRDYRMKMDLPYFNGQLHIEDFFDWILEVERFFDYMEIEDAKKVKLLAYMLKGGGSAWWEQLQTTLRRHNKALISSWP